MSFRELNTIAEDVRFVRGTVTTFVNQNLREKNNNILPREVQPGRPLTLDEYRRNFFNTINHTWYEVWPQDMKMYAASLFNDILKTPNAKDIYDGILLCHVDPGKVVIFRDSRCEHLDLLYNIFNTGNAHLSDPMTLTYQERMTWINNILFMGYVANVWWKTVDKKQFNSSLIFSFEELIRDKSTHLLSERLLGVKLGDYVSGYDDLPGLGPTDSKDLWQLVKYGVIIIGGVAILGTGAYAVQEVRGVIEDVNK